MKRLFLIAIFATAAYFTTYAEEGMKWGLGASLGVSLAVNGNAVTMPTAILVPLHFSQSFILEPFVMLSTASNSSQVEGSTTKNESSNTNWGIGTSAYWAMATNHTFTPYFGARVGYGSSGTKSKAGETTSDDWTQTQLSLAGILGGDYWFSGNFSLGIEVGLNYMMLGKPSGKMNGGDIKYSDYTNSQIFTSSAIIARIFF